MKNNQPEAIIITFSPEQADVVSNALTLLMHSPDSFIVSLGLTFDIIFDTAEALDCNDLCGSYEEARAIASSIVVTCKYFGNAPDIPAAKITKEMDPDILEDLRQSLPLLKELAPSSEELLAYLHSKP